MQFRKLFRREIMRVKLALLSRTLDIQKASNNPVLQKDTEQGGIVTGTGHCMLIDIHNRLYCSLIMDAIEIHW